MVPLGVQIALNPQEAVLSKPLSPICVHQMAIRSSWVSLQAYRKPYLSKISNKIPLFMELCLTLQIILVKK